MIDKETENRYFYVVSSGIIFIIHPDNIIKLDNEARLLMAEKAYTANQQCFLVPTKLGQISMQIVNIMNKIEDIEIIYSSFGYVSEDSGFIKSIEEIESKNNTEKIH